MPPSSPQDERSIREPHPLARALIERLAPPARVLDFATGSGRNAEALRRAGFEVITIADGAAASEDPMAGLESTFAAIVSTHGFLHGTAGEVARRLTAVVAPLPRGGVLYATFGSTRDARFGQGQRIDNRTFAPIEGDERGVAHAFFDETALREAFGAALTIETLEERDVDEIAGRWAHTSRPLTRAVHWFAIARKL